VDAVVFASRTGARLELSPAPWPYEDPDGNSRWYCWQARLTGRGLDASLICPEERWMPQSLADFLAGLDEDWRGWPGERSWGTEELTLTARHEKENTVVIQVVLEDGAPPRWSCRAELELDPGVFRQLAADARRLGAESLAL